MLELPAGSSQPQTLPLNGLSAPQGVAIDSAGDVFVADDGSNRVLELPAGSSRQRTLPFTGLSGPEGVAVDPAGDVFVTDYYNNRALELPAGSSQQQTLPLSGLSRPEGVAVDSAGDVFVADSANGRVVELSPSVPSGALLVAPASGPAGTSIGVASMTPCPLGGAFGSTGATYALYSPTGTLVQTATATLDGSGDWSGALTIPANAVNGTTYFVGASVHGRRRGRGGKLLRGDVRGRSGKQRYPRPSGTHWACGARWSARSTRDQRHERRQWGHRRSGCRGAEG